MWHSGESGKSGAPSMASWASEERIVQVPPQTAAPADPPLAPAPFQMSAIPGCLPWTEQNLETRNFQT